MDLAKKILEIRKASGLTQDDFAKKLFVTRQAVSRWENGETAPTLDTLKTVFELFKVDVTAFFGDDAPICQSCSMPLKRLDNLGINADGTVNTEYCNYCFAGGKFTRDRTVDEMVEANLRFLTEYNEGNGTNYTIDEARTILKAHLETLKRWKKT